MADLAPASAVAVREYAPGTVVAIDGDMVTVQLEDGRRLIVPRSRVKAARTDTMQLCYACGKYCRRTLNVCPHCDSEGAR